jgi:hypothetical protein
MVHHKQSKKVDLKPKNHLNTKIESQMISEFYFKPKLKKINWRLLSGVSVGDIVATVTSIELEQCKCVAELDGYGYLL